MDAIGVVPIPADFKYMDVLQKGKPKHERFDEFSVRHPKMDCRKRAKIFAPFDALRGFDFAISRKEVLYTDRPELSQEELQELNRRLGILKSLTRYAWMARRNHVVVTATYFVPCGDRQHEAYGEKGQISTVTGVCSRVDHETAQIIQIENRKIPFADLLRIEGNRRIFGRKYEDWNDEYNAVI